MAMWLSRYIQSVIALALSLTVLAGCATTPNMGYTSNAPRQANKNVSIWLKSFTDGRSAAEKGILGGVYNGYNMRMGDVTEPANTIESIKKSFESELDRAGYNIVMSEQDLVATAEVVSVTCDARLKSESLIRVRIKLQDKGNEVLDKVYTGRADAFVIVGFATSQALNASIKKIATELVKDLDEYIKS